MICRLVNVTKSYPLGDLVVAALRNVSVGVEQGEFTVFAGPSGSGKSTALNLLGCLDRPSAGAVELDSKNVATLSDDALGAVRARRIGFIFYLTTYTSTSNCTSTRSTD